MVEGGVVAIVPAAGIGSRFGGGVKKTFYELDGKPVLIRTLEALERVELISEIIPALREEDHGRLRQYLSQYAITKVKKIAPGGKERQDSVWNALRLVARGTTTVAVHDGVRPFATPAFISGLIGALNENDVAHAPSVAGWDAVVPGLMPKDTIKEVTAEGSVRATLRRESLVAVQTPQVFLYKSLFAAYEKAMARGFYATDDSALVEAAGGRVRIAPGLPENIKITTPADIMVSEAIILGAKDQRRVGPKGQRRGR
ncbi:MAG: 2-C-methyl-D-erythritol 4-phosphate cytidylyltransferase [Nitrospiraceae bacterium]|nr:2-C-methyl-D-erythritol 4-phosphate cytidylyltransferase [Nitrospiraceae bacterium]